MKRLLRICSAGILAAAFPVFGVGGPAAATEWQRLFDGKSLSGWKAGVNAATFRAEEGAIVVEGEPGYLYYVGSVMNHDFRNFELQVQVMTSVGSNSGIYFHTEYRDAGDPPRGYEAQINNSSPDPRKTGSLYAISDVSESAAADGRWFGMHITVRGRRITIAVDGRKVVDYSEPPRAAALPGRAGRFLSSGTFALQGHDRSSSVRFREILVRPLPD